MKPDDALLHIDERSGCVGVGVSGGVDSSALLLALVRRREHLRTQGSALHVRALHVHHGLQAAADDFAAHVTDQCARWQVPLAVLHVDARNPPGASPEAVARDKRYEALAHAAQAQGCSRVLLAQHADDQAETVLLALTRGAGVAGLAAMGAHFERRGMRFERPLLALTRADLAAWLRQQGERAIEDPTNADTDRTRNRLRAGVGTALQRDFPGYQLRFARSAAHAAHAAQLLAELALIDLENVGRPPRVAVLRNLTRHRQANLLRFWLVSDCGTQASSAQMHELLEQVAACATRGHRIELRIGAGRVLREASHLVYQPGSL